MLEKSTILLKDGEKTFRERIAAGRESIKRKLAQGYEWTPDGLLNIKDIRDAGYVFVEGFGWSIPSEEYIADGTGDRKAGEKYTGVSRRYLLWKEGFLNKRYTNQKEERKQPTLLEAVPVVSEDGEIDIAKIPF